MRLRIDGWYNADEGKYFVLTEKGKECSASYRNMAVGEPVSEYDYEAVKWAVDKGYLVEVPIPDWIEKEGYKVVYDHNGYTLSAGNPIVFPERELAEKYMANYSYYPVKYDKACYYTGYRDVKLYITTAVFKGRKLKDCREYNGKKVYNQSWYYGPSALAVGDLVEENIVDDIINALPPACMRSDCVQLGEPAGMTLDESGNIRSTFYTFKRVADDVFEYCGECIRGRNSNSCKEECYG